MDSHISKDLSRRVHYQSDANKVDQIPDKEQVKRSDFSGVSFVQTLSKDSAEYALSILAQGQAEKILKPQEEIPISRMKSDLAIEKEPFLLKEEFCNDSQERGSSGQEQIRLAEFSESTSLETNLESQKKTSSSRRILDSQLGEKCCALKEEFSNNSQEMGHIDSVQIQNISSAAGCVKTQTPIMTEKSDSVTSLNNTDASSYSQDSNYTVLAPESTVKLDSEEELLEQPKERGSDSEDFIIGYCIGDADSSIEPVLGTLICAVTCENAEHKSPVGEKNFVPAMFSKLAKKNNQVIDCIKKYYQPFRRGASCCLRAIVTCFQKIKRVIYKIHIWSREPNRMRLIFSISLLLSFLGLAVGLSLVFSGIVSFAYLGIVAFGVGAITTLVVIFIFIAAWLLGLTLGLIITWLYYDVIQARIKEARTNLRRRTRLKKMDSENLRKTQSSIF